MTSVGAQNSIVITTLPEFPWVPGQKLDAIPLNNAFIAIHQQLDNIANQIKRLQDVAGLADIGVNTIVNFGGGELVRPGPYVMFSGLGFPFFLTSMDAFAGTNAGSFTYTVTVGGSPVPGLINILVSGLSKQTNTIPPFNVPAGVEVDVLVSNVIGTPLNAYIALNGQSRETQLPILGVGAGLAFGTSQAVGISLSVAQNSAVGFASSVAIVQGVFVAAANARGTAVGQATGTAVGVSVLLNAAVGSASGSSTAQAVGSFQNLAHILVLDDPVYGALDVYPLD